MFAMLKEASIYDFFIFVYNNAKSDKKIGG